MNFLIQLQYWASIGSDRCVSNLMKDETIYNHKKEALDFSGAHVSKNEVN